MKKFLLTLVVAMAATVGFAQKTGSAEAPLSVAEFLEEGATSAAVTNTFVKGYIVGSVVSPNGEYGQDYFVTVGGETASGTNLLIADAKGETDITKTVVVQLPSGAERDALNPKANADNVGKLVVLQGDRQLYFKVPGLKKVVAHTWVAEGEETGVNAIVSEGEAVYFNLQGVRVAQPEKGLYIRVANGKAVKVVK